MLTPQSLVVGGFQFPGVKEERIVIPKLNLWRSKSWSLTFPGKSWTAAIHFNGKLGLKFGLPKETAYGFHRNISIYVANLSNHIFKGKTKWYYLIETYNNFVD